MNKKFLTNLVCGITGAYFGWVLTDIYHMRKKSEELKMKDELIEMSLKQFTDLESLYLKLSGRFGKYKKCVWSVVSAEEMENIEKLYSE